MKNLKQISRRELKTVKGGTEFNCHCAPAGSGKPPLDTIAPDAETCFNICDNYRNS
ncbi:MULTISPECIES: bacteriocin-like protein [Chryseobacterium]|uniref:bacteriocin-like protein n=1 Tax=Chryseobacterium TaxID=59732 RepID=UPI000AF43E2F